MSRLDNFVNRLLIQRLLLDRACRALNEAAGRFPGPVVELGLGNGRTYHHLREKLECRRIIVFDYKLVAHPASHPPPEDLVLGDIRETGIAHCECHGATAVMLHADLGDGTEADDLRLRTWLPHVAHALVKPGGQIIASTELHHPGLEPEPLPQNAPHYDYFIYGRI